MNAFSSRVTSVLFCDDINLKVTVEFHSHSIPSPCFTRRFHRLSLTSRSLCINRQGREFTMYLSTRWDMVMEREAFHTDAAPALQQMLDSRGVAFGCIDVRNDMPAEELQTPAGVDAILVNWMAEVH